MRISRLVLIAGAFALAACDTGLVTRKAPASIRLSDGTVVAGTRGWCIDRATSKAGPGAAVVVLGSCAAIAGNRRAPAPKVPGIVTVSLEREAGEVPAAADLAKFLSTDSGRALLAADGRSESVKILETVIDGDRLFLRIRDNSASPGTAKETWRALFDLGGRFASVSLYAQAGTPIGRDRGLETLSDQVDKLAAANG